MLFQIIFLFAVLPTVCPWSGILLCGQLGCQTYTPYVEPHGAEATFLDLPTAGQPMLGINAMLKFNGFVYLLGGDDAKAAVHDDVYIVNVDTNRTTKGVDLPMPVWGQSAATLLYNSSIVMCGGSNVSISDISGQDTCMQFSGGEWSEIANYPDAFVFGQIVVLNYRPFGFGGSNTDGTAVTSYAFSNAVYEYATSANWLARKPMPTAKQAFGAVAVNRTTALICGGQAFDDVTKKDVLLSECHYYSASTDMWTPTFSLTQGRRYHSLIQFADRIWCVGGSTDVHVAGEQSVEIFDAEIGWQVLSQMLFKADWTAGAVAVGHGH